MSADVVSALCNLGYKKADVKGVVVAAREQQPGVEDVGVLVVCCMRMLKGPQVRRLEPLKGGA